MSTSNRSAIKLEDLLQPIQDLLNRIDEESLRKSHASVLLSFEQMLAYTDSVSITDMRPEIKRLLDIYQDMAKKFYAQYERTLLEKLWDHKSQEEDADHALVMFDKFRARPEFMTGEKKVEDAMHTASTLLENSRQTGITEFGQLQAEFATLLQKAVDKLKSEWQRLHTIAVASKTLDRDEKLIQAMNAVVEAARFSIGVNVDRIAVVPGETFSLQFYSYLKNFAVLTVPIYSVQAPWEWSIFWHELAGNKVRRLERDNAMEISNLRSDLKAFHERFRKAANESPESEDRRKRLLAFIARSNLYSPEQKGFENWPNHFTQKYLADFLSKEISFRDCGGFEHQFERMLERLPRKDRFKQYEQLKSRGWCVDWFKELFEDAWSILAIRDPFLIFFEDVLKRHIASDGRHPDMEIRWAVAKEVLRLMKSDTQIRDPQDIIQSAAQQILKFISLLIACPMLDSIPEYSQRNDYASSLRPQFADMVGQEIGRYIQKWSDRLLGSQLLEESRKDAEEFIRTLGAPEMKDFIQYISAPREEDLIRFEESYDELLMGKGYEELLKLSFYESDFGLSVTTLKFVYEGPRSITIENLKNAIAAHKITRTRITETQSQLNFDQAFESTTTWWASEVDLKALTISPRIG